MLSSRYRWTIFAVGWAFKIFVDMTEVKSPDEIPTKEEAVLPDRAQIP